MINGMEDMAFLAGIIMGSIQLLAVSWVWINKQVLGAGGITMSFVGVALVGLALWSSIRIEATPEGILAQFEREIEEINESMTDVNNRVAEVDSNLQDVVTTNITLNRDFETLSNSITNTNRQFVALTDRLESSAALNGAQLDDLRQGVVAPQLEEADIRLRTETLQAIQRNQ